MSIAANVGNTRIDNAQEEDKSIRPPLGSSIALNNNFSSPAHQGSGAGANTSTDIGLSRLIGEGRTENPVVQQTSGALAPGTAGVGANDLTAQAPASGRDPPTPSVENQDPTFQVTNQIPQPTARHSPRNEPVSYPSNYAARATVESFFERHPDPEHILPVNEPKRSPMNKPGLATLKEETLEILQERFSAKESESDSPTSFLALTATTGQISRAACSLHSSRHYRF